MYKMATGLKEWESEIPQGKPNWSSWWVFNYQMMLVLPCFLISLWNWKRALPVPKTPQRLPTKYYNYFCQSRKMCFTKCISSILFWHRNEQNPDLTMPTTCRKHLMHPMNFIPTCPCPENICYEKHWHFFHLAIVFLSCFLYWNNEFQ